MELLQPGLGLLVWTLLAFLIVFYILKKFAWTPILATLKERETGIADAITSAEKIKVEMANLKNENEAILFKAREERATVLKEAKEQSDKMIAEAKDKAKSEYDKILADAQLAIEHQKNAALIEVKNQVGTLVIEVAQQVLRRELNSKTEQENLLDLAVEQNILEDNYKDTQYLLADCTQSKDFLNILKSPIIQSEKKKTILAAVVKEHIQPLTNLFINLLITKGRERDLAEIVESFEILYNELKGISKVKLTTAIAISDSVKNMIIEKVQEGQKLTRIKLETVVDDKILGGFLIEFNNNLIDASISKELKEIKKQFEGNVFKPSIR